MIGNRRRARFAFVDFDDRAVAEPASALDGSSSAAVR
jgi:hypothetical protein